MKKERVEYLVDSFVDYFGKTRHFVIAAVSEVFTDELHWIDQKVVKGLKLGYSICNPIDEFNEDLGINIAVGRARKNSEYAMLVSEQGYINTTMVQAFLKQEAEYFKKNPETRILNYRRIK